MLKDLPILFEKYNFDYIYINPRDIRNLEFEVKNEELLADFKSPPNYLGSVKINEKYVEVYWNPMVKIGNFSYKFKNIKKERLVKLKQIKKEK